MVLVSECNFFFYLANEENPRHQTLSANFIPVW